RTASTSKPPGKVWPVSCGNLWNRWSGSKPKGRGSPGGERAPARPGFFFFASWRPRSPVKMFFLVGARPVWSIKESKGKEPFECQMVPVEPEGVSAMTRDEEQNELLKVRREKMETLRREGIDPFGRRFERTHTARDIHEAFGHFSKEELQEKGEKVTVAGRLMSKRRQGKASFAHLQDVTGQIQIYVRLNDVGEKQYDIFTMADIGDWLGVSGKVFKTNRGET